MQIPIIQFYDCYKIYSRAILIKLIDRISWVQFFWILKIESIVLSLLKKLKNYTISEQ